MARRIVDRWVAQGQKEYRKPGISAMYQVQIEGSEVYLGGKGDFKEDCEVSGLEGQRMGLSSGQATKRMPAEGGGVGQR